MDHSSLETQILAQAPEVITVPADAESVSCDGGHPSLGHPKVYYYFGNKDRVICGYCDREFVKEVN
jgi:uncharacterized Zn-finger protein